MQALESPCKRQRTSIPARLVGDGQNVILVSSDNKEFQVTKTIAEHSAFIHDALEDHNIKNVQVFTPSIPVMCKAVVLEKVIGYLVKLESGATEEEMRNFDEEFVKANDGSMLFCLALASDYLHIPNLLRLTSNAIADRMNYSKTAEEIRQKFEGPHLADNTEAGLEAQDLEVVRDKVFQLVCVQLFLVKKLEALIMCAQAYKEWKMQSLLYVDASGIDHLVGSQVDAALSEIISLEHLNLSCNSLSPGMVSSLMTMGKTALTFLDLSCLRDYRPQSISGAEAATALAPSLALMTRLQTLNLARNAIGESGATALAVSLGKMAGMKKLNLEGNDMQNEGLRMLVPSLGNMTGLEKLSLANNGILDEGAAELASLLRIITGLHWLDIAENSFFHDPQNLYSVWQGQENLSTHERKEGERDNDEDDGDNWKEVDEDKVEENDENDKGSEDGCEESDSTTMLDQKLGDVRRGEDDNESEECDAESHKREDVKKIVVHHQHEDDDDESEDDHGYKGLASQLNPFSIARQRGGTALAESLAVLTQLKVLGMRRTAIGCRMTEAIASSLYAMTGLQILDISNNFLVLDDDAIAEGGHINGAKLGDMDGRQQATALAPSLRVLTGLRELDLSANGIGDVGVSVLASSLSVLTGLRCLSIDANDITDNGVSQLESSLSLMTQMQTLTLQHNEISHEGYKTLAKCLAVMDGLRTLAIDKLDPVSSEELARSVATMIHLEKLKICCCTFGMETGIVEDTAFSKFLRSKFNMRCLEIDSVPLWNLGVEVLAGLFDEMQKLQKISLRNICMGDVGFAALVPALSSMQDLKELELPSNNITACEATSLFPSLSHITGLVLLNLNDNDIAISGVRALAPWLALMTSMQTLNLGGNLVHKAGATALAPSLYMMPELRQLDLSTNDLDDEGLEALAPSLRVMIRLVKLSLEGNNLSDGRTRTLLPWLPDVVRRKSCGIQPELEFDEEF